MIRVLVLSPGLPASNNMLTMAPLARQIDSLRSAGLQVTNMEVTGLPKVKYLQTMPRLWRAAKDVDLIHAHYGYCGWLARTCRSKPVVVSFMGDDLLGTPNSQGGLLPLSRLAVLTNKRLASMVDAVIVKSAEMERVLTPVAAQVIPNGVDLKTFAPIDKREARQQLGWPANKRRVLFPGNPAVARKSYPLAVAAVKSAQRQLEDPIELVVLWRVPPHQVPLYMNACDAMLMTSFIEGSPNVVKEAMACDLPVVSVPVGDVPELVEGVSGYEVRPRNADEIGAALAGLLLQRPAVHGRQALIRMGLGLDSIAHRIRGLYESVLRSRVTRV